MSEARTARRRRKQALLDPRYAKPRIVISKKLQGRSKLLALKARTTATTYVKKA